MYVFKNKMYYIQPPIPQEIIQANFDKLIIKTDIVTHTAETIVPPE